MRTVREAHDRRERPQKGGNGEDAEPQFPLSTAGISD